MRVRYHVAILNAAADTMLVERQEDLWMLPTAAAEDRVRGADIVDGCLASLGVTGRLRWMEPVAFDARSSELQTLAVVDTVVDGVGDAIQDPHSVAAAPLQPALIECLHPRQAILEPQAHALACYREAFDGDSRNIQRHCADFRHAETWTALDDWLTQSLATAGLAACRRDAPVQGPADGLRDDDSDEHRHRALQGSRRVAVRRSRSRPVSGGAMAEALRGNARLRSRAWMVADGAGARREPHERHDARRRDAGRRNAGLSPG